MTPSGYFLSHLWLIPLFPLITAALMLFIGRTFPKSAVSFFCVGSVFLSFLHAAGAVWQLLCRRTENRFYQLILFEWITPGAMPANGGLVNFVADWGYLLDPLSCVMVLVVTGVGFLIHVYSIGYMGHEGGYYRFFGYLNLFMFSMLTLVLANNLLLLFVGWEGVGLCSYLLIGFYFLKKSASDAGKKAFIVNRIGDTGFLLGIFLIATTFGTIRFTSHGLADPIALPGIVQTLRRLLVVNIPLAVRCAHSHGNRAAPLRRRHGQVRAVPALRLAAGRDGRPHAGQRVDPRGHDGHRRRVHGRAHERRSINWRHSRWTSSPSVGASTAIYAASMALVQNDIKKVLAYSTISQLGYMFLALGVGAFSAGIFHLMTHAFFKALLFLGAGSVIHALSGEQDIRKMGGLWNAIPATITRFMIATLAIAGIPPFAGFFSKDEILGHAFSRHSESGRLCIFCG